MGEDELDDLELEGDEAERVRGGATPLPDVSRPPAPPSGPVPIPYPNTYVKK